MELTVHLAHVFSYYLYVSLSSYTLDCGWQTELQDFTRISEWSYSEGDIIIPLFVPEGYTFQHFIDGVLPKIIQACTSGLYSVLICLSSFTVNISC